MLTAWIFLLARGVRVSMWSLILTFLTIGLATAETEVSWSDSARPPPSSKSRPTKSTKGDTPGTYSRYVFDGLNGLQNLNTTLRVLTDPGRAANVFWALEYGFVGKELGSYVGLQTNGSDEERTIIFSIWDTTEAEPGDPESYCTTFTGEGRGRSCRMRYPWEANRDYKFAVTMEPGGWVRLTVADVALGKTLNIGRIKNGASLINPRMGNWVEYFEWFSSQASCLNQPYSQARFQVPFVKIGNESRSARVSEMFEEQNSCQSDALVERQGDQVVFTGGRYNSVRGPIKVDLEYGSESGIVIPDKSMVGSPLKVYRQNKRIFNIILSEDGLFTDRKVCLARSGSIGHVSGCDPWPKEQYWNVPLVNTTAKYVRYGNEVNTCLLPPATSGGIVKVGQCDGVGGDNPSKWRLTSDRQLVNSISGECLALVGSGYAPVTQACDKSRRAQRWYVFDSSPMESNWVFSKDRTVRLENSLCLIVSPNGRVGQGRCDQDGVPKQWEMDSMQRELAIVIAGERKCLDRSSGILTVETCNDTWMQKWDFPEWPNPQVPQ